MALLVNQVEYLRLLDLYLEAFLLVDLNTFGQRGQEPILIVLSERTILNYVRPFQNGNLLGHAVVISRSVAVVNRLI
jgi:hypothetical protein